MNNKTTRVVVHNYFIRDINNSDTITEWQNLEEVKKHFEAIKDRQVILIQNKNVIFVIRNNSILAYKYKMV